MKPTAAHSSDAHFQASTSGVNCDTPEFRVVALGASAGGIESIQQFFRQIPSEPGFAYILLQRSKLDQPLLLADVLKKFTPLPVIIPENEVKLQGGHIYLIPPRAVATVRKGSLHIHSQERPTDGGNPFDQLLRSLAREFKEKVIAAIFSGTGTDGALGLQAVKQEGGLTLAQSVVSARYGSMPRAAITSGVVDWVIRPDEMPAKILQYVQHLKGMHFGRGEGVQEEIAGELSHVLSLMRRRTGHDFSRYKPSTLLRRIQRRMQLNYLATVHEYLELLRRDPKEVEGLFRDSLIGVTQFFRDPEVFEALQEQLLQEVLKNKSSGTQFRVWVPGCASGEEVYSLAILLSEALEQLEISPKPIIQIFGTDIDEDALEKARKGRYPESIAEEISPQRLNRFFVRRGSSYEVTEELRAACLFSEHNLIGDPPFSRIDLISCRNLLIYFESDLQKELLGVFHFALNPSGLLVLGPSENIASRSEWFRVLDKKHRIFQRKPGLLRSSAHLSSVDAFRPKRPSFSPVELKAEHNLGRVIERIILEDYSPPGIVVNEQGEVVYFCGPVGKFLEPAAGVPTHRVTNLIKKDLRIELRTALNKATATHEEIVREGIRVRNGKKALEVNLIVRPLPEAGKEAGLFMVLFQEQSARVLKGSRRNSPPLVDEDFPLLQQLESELRATRDELQSTIEELETSNEELKSANEELLSMNEELQSSNEELQTSKEELHSVNEELHRKVEELDSANSDLQNLFQSSQVATLFLDRELRLRRFTPAISQVAGVFERDVGRSILDLIPDLARGGFEKDFEAVLETETTRERQGCFGGGRLWCIVRVMPYRNVEQVSDGLVVTFADVTELKQAEQRFQRTSTDMVRMLDRINDAFSAFDAQWRVTYVNRRCRELLSRLDRRPEDLIGKVFWQEFPDLVGTEVEHQYRRAVQEQVPVTFELFYPPLNAWFEIRAYPGADGLSVYSQDITVRKRAEQETAEKARISSLRAEVSLALSSQDSLQMVLQRSCESILRHLDLACARIWLLNRENSELHLLASAGCSSDLDAAESHIKIYETKLGWIAQSGEPHLVKGLQDEPESSDLFRARSQGMVSFAGYPMILDGNVVGVLAGYARHVLSESTLAELPPIANSIAQWVKRRRAEEAMVESEQRFRSLSVCSPVGIFMTDVAGRCTYTNPKCQGICGFSFEEALGSGWSEFVHPEDRVDTFTKWSECARTGREFTMEFRFQSSDQEVRWTHIRTAPLMSDSGQLIGHVGTVEDITLRKRAEEALLHSHQEIRNILNRIADGFIALDNQWRLTFLNQQAETVMGKLSRDPSGIIGRNLWDEFPELQGTLLQQRLEQALRDQRPVNLENYDPQLKAWFDIRAYPSTDGLSIFFHDITERKRAQEALRESESRYRRIIETANEGVWMVDGEFRTTFVNSRVVEMLGYPQEELLGRRVTEFVLEEDIPYVRLKIAERRQGRRDQYDVRLRCKNGEVLWVLLCMSPIVDEDGNFVGALGMLTDISERKRAEEELQHQMLLMKTITENVTSCLMMMDAAGRPTFMNPAAERITGYTLEQIRHAPLHEAVHHHHPDGRYYPKADCPIERSSENLLPLRNHEDVFVRKDGSFYPVLCSVAPLEKEGQRIGAVLEFRDVTEQKQAQRALKEANAKLSRYAEELEQQVAERTRSLKETVQSLEGVCYTMAHDLRGPLRAMHGFTKLLLQERESLFDEEGKEYAGRIISAAMRMDTLIRDLLEYAKLSQTNLPLGPLNLEEEVQSVITDFNSEIQAKQAQVRVHPLPVVVGNATLLKQILLNLLDNALKFVHPDKRPLVEFRSEIRGDAACLRVQDNGIGIAPEHHDRVFGLFERLHNEEVYPGTGIGLAIVRKGMERMGGSVRLESVSGSGSCFVLELPLAKKS